MKILRLSYHILAISILTLLNGNYSAQADREHVVSLFFKVSASIFKWLDQNMLVYILTTAKNFEYVIVFCCAILFFIDYRIYHVKTTKESNPSHILYK